MAHAPAPALCAAIVEHGADAIVFADREGKIRLWNRAAERMFGFTAAEALGQSLDIIIPAHLRARHWDGYRLAMDSGVTKHSGKAMRTKALHRTGESLYAEVSFAVVRDPDAGIVGAVVIAREPRAG